MTPGLPSNGLHELRFNHVDHESKVTNEEINELKERQQNEDPEEQGTNGSFVHAQDIFEHVAGATQHGWVERAGFRVVVGYSTHPAPLVRADGALHVLATAFFLEGKTAIPAEVNFLL